MRQTYDRKTLVQKWLTQEQPSARDNIGGNLYFEGDIIYSYGKHFPIARLFHTSKGENIVLFTAETNSPTTEKHKSLVYRGCLNSSRRIVIWFGIDLIIPGNTRALSDCKRQFDAAVAKHNKARKPELYVAHIYYWVKVCADFFATVFPEDTVPKWAQLPKGIEPGPSLTAALLIHS